MGDWHPPKWKMQGRTGPGPFAPKYARGGGGGKKGGCLSSIVILVLLSATLVAVVVAIEKAQAFADAIFPG